MKAYCINLESRADRWEQVQKEFDRVGLHVERFNAIRRVNGHKGCIRSHKALVRYAHKQGVFMVFEDDVKFLGTTQDIETCLGQLPDDWDMLYLGATLMKPLERYSENLFRLKGGLTTHAMIYNNQNKVCQYIHRNFHGDFVDVFFAEDIQEKFNCFIAFPMIATQAPGYSDIVMRHTEYEEIMSSYKRFTK